MRSRTGKKRTQTPRSVNSAQKTTSHAPRAAGPKPPQGGLFLWGRHAVLAALANPERRIAALYVSSDAAKQISEAIAALPGQRQRDLPPPHPTDRARLDAIRPAGDSQKPEQGKAIHQGMVAAVWPLESPDLADFLAGFPTNTDDGEAGDSALPRPRLRLLLLDQLSDPRNVGAIMRTALALGASAIITTHRNAPDETGVLARAAAGALESIPMIKVVNLARAIETLQQADITVVGLAGEGDAAVEELGNVERLALVLGAEGTGLRHLTRQRCDRLVRIDIDPKSESLNVSIAAAIALYAAGQMRG